MIISSACKAGEFLKKANTAAVLTLLLVAATACSSNGPGPAPAPPCCTPGPNPVPPAPDPTTPAAPTTGVALFPDGTPAANFQLIFVYSGLAGGDYTDLTTDSNGDFQLPDYSSCNDGCELWIYVPAASNQDLFNQQTSYHENNCELPLAASPNAQTWQDIQLSAQSPATLYVVNSDCYEDWSLAGGISNFHGGLSLSQAGNWIDTSGLEQMMTQGQLDESQGYSGE